MNGYGFVFAFTAVGLLYIALGVPLMRRRVPPNDLYGVRVAATFADESVWYDANAASGRDFVILGIAQLALALLLPSILNPTGAMYSAMNVTATLTGAIAVAITGWRRANRLLEERRRGTVSRSPT